MLVCAVIATNIEHKKLWQFYQKDNKPLLCAEYTLYYNHSIWHFHM